MAVRPKGGSGGSQMSLSYGNILGVKPENNQISKQRGTQDVVILRVRPQWTHVERIVQVNLLVKSRRVSRRHLRRRRIKAQQRQGQSRQRLG